MVLVPLFSRPYLSGHYYTRKGKLVIKTILRVFLGPNEIRTDEIPVAPQDSDLQPLRVDGNAAFTQGI